MSMLDKIFSRQKNEGNINIEKTEEEKRNAFVKNNQESASKLNPNIYDVALGNNRLKDYKHYDGERIAHNEAIKEDETRTKLEQIRKEISGFEGNFEQKQELLAKKQELSAKLEKQQNSSLYAETTFPGMMKAEFLGTKEKPQGCILSGVIDGNKVTIKISPKKDWEESGKSWYSLDPKENPEQFVFKGEKDGKEISQKESMEIFKGYRESATEHGDWWYEN
jgi:hypothetical protein